MSSAPSSSSSSASPHASSSQGPLDSARGRASASLGWQAPPPHLALAQVHYLVRHGERTPVRTRLTRSDPPIPPRWNFCHAGREFATAVADLTPAHAGAERLPDAPWQKKGQTAYRGTMRVSKGTEATVNDRPVPGEEGECLLGELTDLGRASTFALGAALRALYIDELHLLPPTLAQSDADAVYFRSTNMSRTIESCQSVIRGLLPQTRSESDTFVPHILVRNGTDENLLPNTFGCARLRALDGQFAAFAASLHASHLSNFDAAVAPHCDGAPPRVDGHPRLNGIVDTIRAAQAHALPVPSVFERKEVVEAFETAVVDEWFTGYKAQDEALRKQYRRLAMGRLLADLQGRMESKAKKGDEEKLKLALYSAHDTSLAGLLSTLDVFEQRWPAFTASVGIELWRDTRAGKPSLLESLGIGKKKVQHYVRMRYGDETLRLPACAAEGQHLAGAPEFCTLEAFGHAAVAALKHPEGKTWERECEEGRGAKSSK